MQPPIILILESILVALFETVLTVYLTFTDENKCQISLNTWLVIHMMIVMLAVMYINKDIDFENKKFIVVVTLHVIVLFLCLLIGGLIVSIPSDCGDLDSGRYLLIQMIIFEYFLKIIAFILWFLFQKKAEYQKIRTVEDEEEVVAEKPKLERAYSV